MLKIYSSHRNREITNEKVGASVKDGVHILSTMTVDPVLRRIFRLRSEWNDQEAARVSEEQVVEKDIQLQVYMTKACERMSEFNRNTQLATPHYHRHLYGRFRRQEGDRRDV